MRSSQGSVQSRELYTDQMQASVLSHTNIEYIMLESEQFEIRIKPENMLKKDDKDRGNLYFYAYFRWIQPGRGQ